MADNNSTTVSTVETLRDRLIALRKQNGVTQQEAADLIGVPATSWANWESMANVVIPRAKTIEKIAKEFNVSARWLLTGIKPEPVDERHRVPKKDDNAIVYNKSDVEKLNEAEYCIGMLRKISGISKNDKKKLYALLNKVRGEAESTILFGRDE